MQLNGEITIKFYNEDWIPIKKTIPTDVEHQPKAIKLLKILPRTNFAVTQYYSVPVTTSASALFLTNSTIPNSSALGLLESTISVGGGGMVPDAFALTETKNDHLADLSEVWGMGQSQLENWGFNRSTTKFSLTTNPSRWSDKSSWHAQISGAYSSQRSQKMGTLYKYKRAIWTRVVVHVQDGEILIQTHLDEETAKKEVDHDDSQTSKSSHSPSTSNKLRPKRREKRIQLSKLGCLPIKRKDHHCVFLLKSFQQQQQPAQKIAIVFGCPSYKERQAWIDVCLKNGALPFF